MRMPRPIVKQRRNRDGTASTKTGRQKSSARWLTWLGMAGIVLAVLVSYWPILDGGFLLDDDRLLTENAIVQSPDGLARFWFTTEPVDYWPVTSTTLWFEWRLFGPHPGGYHAMN